MMKLAIHFTAMLVVLTAVALPVHAEDRSVLINCKAMVHRAAQAKGAKASAGDAELARCRQVIREWALRDARMVVDEDGRPLR